VTTTSDGGGIEARTQALGQALLDAAERYRPGLAERIEDWLLTRAVADDHFRTRLLRYLDVLSALDPARGGDEAKRLAQEYFDDDFPGLPRPLRWLIRIGRDEHLPAAVVGETAQRATEIFARRFITPPGDETIATTLDALAAAGRYPSFDLLGEAVQSEAEAEAYVRGYLALLARLGARADAHAATAGGVARLQVSLKLSSLTAQFTPVDFEGTIRRVRPALETIAEAAERAGVGLTVDMEQYAYRDLSWAVFRATFARGERFGAWDGAGLVVQAYLRDAARHVEEVVAFARARAAPIQIRLVQGAYWDYETIVAREAGWPSPVFARKADTDAEFERVLVPLVAAHPHVRLAVASHNARSHAIAEALAEARSLPPHAIEHQTLFHTAEGMSEGLVRMGWVARDYVPVGELLPGMAYLVRRVLENSSQAGFLLQSRAGVSREQLLQAPPAVEPAPPAPETSAQAAGAFRRAAAAPWFRAEHREACERALAEARRAWGARQALSIDGAPVAPAETVAITSPSHPAAGPIGSADFAGAPAIAPAVAAALRGAAAWGARPVGERAGILRRAAALLEARHHAFAAEVVHEGGRDRVSAYAEVEEAIDFLAWYAAEAEALFARHGRAISPRGVVAVIPPWNFPLSIPCGMTAAALACGNAVILKPAEQTPLVAGRLVELLWEAGVPRSALIALPGRGETVGAALAEHPDVAMIAFTGSRAVGTALHATVSRVVLADGGQKTLVAELGGKNPILVFADADLDEAVAAILASAFGHAGQRCSAASRVLVERTILARLRERLVEAARSLAVGPADAAATQINPVIDREARDRLLGAAAVARREGEVALDRFVEPGKGPLSLGPLIVTIEPDRTRTSATAMDELFGPILALIPFDDEAQAFSLANETGYGLTAGVFTRSPRTLDRALVAVLAGNLYVNRTITGARVGVEPFGGLGLSGTGPKAGGPDTLWAYVRRTDVDATGSTTTPTTESRTPSVAPPPASESASAFGSTTAAEAASIAAALPAEIGPRWTAPLDERIAIVERAAAALAAAGDPSGRDALLELAQAARSELGDPRPTLAIAGQFGELRAEPPRGLGLVHARGPAAIAWLAAPLLAGDAVVVVGSPSLVPAVEALIAAGVPGAALAVVEGGEEVLPRLAGSPAVAFVATDATGPLLHATRARLGPTAEGQRWLKALLSPLDGPQPGEPGFLRRFAWAKTIAIRTLRHGAELAIEPAADEG